MSLRHAVISYRYFSCIHHFSAVWLSSRGIGMWVSFSFGRAISRFLKIVQYRHVNSHDVGKWNAIKCEIIHSPNSHLTTFGI